MIRLKRLALFTQSTGVPGNETDYRTKYTTGRGVFHHLPKGMGLSNNGTADRFNGFALSKPQGASLGGI